MAKTQAHMTNMAEVWKALGIPEPPRPGPCWCNGPYPKDSLHHQWCREFRAYWRKALRALKSMSSDKPKNFLSMM